MSLVRERERGTLEQLLVSPLSRWGLMLGKLMPYLCIGLIDGDGLVRDHALGVPRADCGQRGRDVGRGGGLCVCAVEPGVADFHARAKSDAGAADDDGVHPAVGVFLRVHFPARNDAVDFLRHRQLSADDLFHRIDACDYFSRRKLAGVLGEHRRSNWHGSFAVYVQRASVQAAARIS